VATIPLGRKPEGAVPDRTAGRVFMNTEDLNNIAVIEKAEHTVVAHWPIAPREEAAGLAIDTKNHRLFIGAHDKFTVMMDSTNGKVVGQVSIATGVDATWFDPGTGDAFSSYGDGTTTIAHEDSPSKVTVVQTLKTAPGTRTMALAPGRIASISQEPIPVLLRRGRLPALAGNTRLPGVTADVAVVREAAA